MREHASLRVLLISMLHFRKLWRTVEEDFPESDIVATVYSGEITYTLDDFEKIEGLIAEFERYQSETDFLDSES